MTEDRLANDLCEPLIVLYQSWLAGWRPSPVSEERYQELKAKKDPRDPITAFAGFGLSFGGKFFGGYARNARQDDFFGQARNSLTRKLKKCEGVEFTNLDFEDLNIPDGSLVYLDPPYRNTIGYKATGEFDHDRFEAWAKALSRRCVVAISGYEPADGWTEVANFAKRSCLSSKTERLFVRC
jgi:DNA adenine methylase